MDVDKWQINIVIGIFFVYKLFQQRVSKKFSDRNKIFEQKMVKFYKEKSREKTKRNINAESSLLNLFKKWHTHWFAFFLQHK